MKLGFCDMVDVLEVSTSRYQQTSVGVDVGAVGKSLWSLLDTGYHADGVLSAVQVEQQLHHVVGCCCFDLLVVVRIGMTNVEMHTMGNTTLSTIIEMPQT